MVAVLAFCGSVVSLMQTLVVPILPDLPRIFNAPAEDTSWIVTATLLAAAVSHPVVGRLGDMYGKRRMVLIILALMVVGSAICALTTSLAWVVLGRALQGLAIGVIPLSISIMRDNLTPERLGSAMATPLAPTTNSANRSGAGSEPVACEASSRGNPSVTPPMPRRNQRREILESLVIGLAPESA